MAEVKYIIEVPGENIVTSVNIPDDELSNQPTKQELVDLVSLYVDNDFAAKTAWTIPEAVINETWNAALDGVYATIPAEFYEEP